MTDPLPEWMRQVPSLESLHDLPNVPWGGYTPRDIQLPSLPQLDEFMRMLLKNFLGWLAKAFGGIEFAGWDPYAWLVEWRTTGFPTALVAFINSNTGLNFASWSAFVASLDDNHGIDLPVLPQLLAALDGIDLDGDPGAVLRAIIERLASAVPDLFSISRITNAIQDLARGAGEFLNADALIDGPFEWDDLTPGWLSGKSAKATADGTTQIIRTDVFEVFEGQTLSERAAAMWAGYSGSGATISTGWSFYDAAGALISDVAKGSITPPGSSGAWQWIPVTGHTVPAGVKYAAQFLQLGSGATAGNVWFSNARPWASNLGAQALIQDLPEDLEALLDWLTNFVEEGLSKLGVPAVGTLFDKINDLTDEWAIVQDTGDNAVAALEDIGDIFDAALITPTQAAAVKVQGFFEKFFGGGPWNVLSQNQLAAASGAAPLDAGGTVPLENMHPSLIGAMLGVSYATLEIPSNQSIPNATETKLASWSQTGPATLTFTSDNFKLPYAGFWDIEVCSLWGASSTGIRECALKRNGTVIKAEGVPANGFSVYGPRNNVTTRVNATTTDEFSVHVAQTSGGALNCMASGTFVRCTFVGTTDTPVAVTFDAASAGTSGTYSEYGFNHTFGANAQTLVVPISHTGNSTLTAVVVRNAANTADEYTVPIGGGSTHVGNYFGYDAYAALAATILPAGVKGATRNVRVRFSGTNYAASMCGLSFNGVGALGNPVQSKGTGSPTLLVPSNNTSMVAMHFGGMDVNFSSFNQTNDYQVGFSAGSRWSHVIGHAPGGSLFTATNSSKWCAQGIELHP